jgi:hypothetical protein
MSISINGTSGLLSSQNITKINTPVNVDSDGDNDSSTSSRSTSTNITPSTFIQGVVQALQGLGVNLTSSKNSNNLVLNNTQASDTTTALQVFIQDLYKTLTQGVSTQSAYVDSDGDNHNISATSSKVSAYNSPSANLNSLISSLSSNSDQSSTLQTDLSNLIQASSNSSSSTSLNVSIQDFLKQLSSTNFNNNQIQNLGTFFNATA